MSKRKVIGAMPGHGKLARNMRNAETAQEAYELFFSSRHVPDDEKRRIMSAIEMEALMKSPLRRMARQR